MTLAHRIFLVLILFFINMISVAQTTIRGSVVEKGGEVLVGANVYLEGTYDGASSGIEGDFEFTTTESGTMTLIVSFLGYKEYRTELILKDEIVELRVELQEAINRIDGVVITAGAFEASGEHKREVLRPLDIVTTAGATADLAGALNTLPGTQTVGEEGRLFVRGGDGRETRTYIDGLQVMSFYSPSAPGTPTRGRYLPFMFKGTSFSTGGYSAEYGQALSSALILNTKDEATMTRSDISIMTVGGDFAHTQAWQNSSLSGKLQYTNIDPYYGLINQEIDWIDPPTSAEGIFAFRTKVNTNGSFKVFGNLNRSGLTLNRNEMSDPTLDIRTRIDNTYYYLNTSFEDVFADSWKIRTGISYTHNLDDIGLDQDLFTTLSRGGHAKLALDHNLSEAVGIKFGGDLFYREVNQEYEDFSGVSTNSFDEALPAFFAESDVYFSNDLVGRMGLRYEYSSLQTEGHLSPRVSLAYKTGENSQVSAAYGIFYQVPEDKFLLENPGIEMERSDHYILNYQIIENNRTFRIEGYYKDYDNLITFQPSNLSTVQNDGFGFSRGIDIFWRDNRTFNNVDYWLSYSFLDTERLYLDFPSTAVPTFASKHNFSAVYKHFISDLKTQLGFTYSFGSGRPYHDPNTEGFNSGRTSNYHDLSFNLAYLYRDNIILYTSVTNVPGRDNIFGYEFSPVPDMNGEFPGRAQRLPARRFFFVALLITISKENTANQLPSL